MLRDAEPPLGLNTLRNSDFFPYLLSHSFAGECTSGSIAKPSSPVEQSAASGESRGAQLKWICDVRNYEREKDRRR